MGLIDDFNGIDVAQTVLHVKTSCATHIDQTVTAHAWQEDKKLKDVAKIITPLNTKALKQVHDEPKGPPEGTAVLIC